MNLQLTQQKASANVLSVAQKLNGFNKFSTIGGAEHWYQLISESRIQIPELRIKTWEGYKVIETNFEIYVFAI